ncbi:MAG: AAA family ATPase [Candidatus Binataceae bacterium]
MRPLKLSVEGFTCFRRAQEINFSNLDLFAITGPMGAGKSSILDAMMFVLYGKVPRLGKKTLSELISHGADRVSVLFDFELAGRVFRATRIGYRTKATQAQLDRIQQGKEQPIASGVQQVNAEIERLLGLRYEAFTQAVILPQGEFAKFLQSTPADQGEILRDLLRLQIYERMRDAASQRSRELTTDSENLRRRLTEDYADASPEILAKETENAERLREHERKLANELKAIQADLGELKLRHGQTKDLEEKRQRLSGLKKRAREISAAEAKVEAAKRAAPVVPVIEAAIAAETKAVADTNRLSAARKQENGARDEHRTTQKQLEKARREAERVPELKQLIAQVDEIRGLIAPLKDARKRVEAAEKQGSKLSQDIANARASAKKSSEDLSRYSAQLNTAKKDLIKLEYDPQLDRRLEAVREDATELRAIRNQLRERKAEFKTAEDEATNSAAKAQKSEAALFDLSEKRETASRSVSHLEEELKRTEREEAALIIRGMLREGEPCPVCTQMVSRLPARAGASVSEAARAQLDHARTALAKAEKNLSEQREVALTARNHASSASVQASQLRQRIEELAEAVIQAERKISKVAAEVQQSAGEPEDRILDAAKRCAKQRGDYDTLKEQVANLEKSLNSAEHAERSSADKAKALSEQLKERTEELKQAKREVKTFEEKITKVVGSRDPDAERERLNTTLNTIERVLKTAEKAESDAASQLARKEQIRIAAEQSAREAEESARKAKQQAAKAARDAQFQDDLTARAAVLPRAELEQFEREITGYRQDLNSCEKSIEDLESQLAEKYVSEETLQAAIAKVDEKQKLLQVAVQELGSTEQRIKQVKEKIQTAAKLSRELKAKSKEQDIYKGLADDLKRDAFQAFLLEDTFAELVRGASVRLKELSDRYTFEYDKSFYVIDHDNAGARRSADTLSGGEKFLASLALALELSEQVQRAAGAVSLDSLFIDEGFATLDAETLNTVAGAIESLHIGGRTIGVITHIEALSERLPACIRVDKRADGSQIQIEAN